jgi:hypothetical protein
MFPDHNENELIVKKLKDRKLSPSKGTSVRGNKMAKMSLETIWGRKGAIAEVTLS